MGCLQSKSSEVAAEDPPTAAPLVDGERKGAAAAKSAKPVPTKVVDATRKGPEHAASLFSPKYAKTTELILSECELTELPVNMGVLPHLVKLDLSANKLASLPASVGKLSKLQTLDVNDNALKSLPDEIGGLESLTSLLLYKNELSALPDSVGELSELTELNLFNNKILKLTPALGKLRKLSELNLSANKVMKIDAAVVEGWSQLTILNVFDCRVVMLPPLGHLQALEELRLFGNQLREMPNFGAGLPNLRILELHRNAISVIPDDFFDGMGAMTKLTLSHNVLTSLPASVGKSKLETLLCDDNKLTELPAELATLTTLRVLMVNGNQIGSLGPEWKQNRLIARLNLAGNPVVGCDDVVEHLQRVCTENKGVFGAPA